LPRAPASGSLDRSGSETIGNGCEERGESREKRAAQGSARTIRAAGARSPTPGRL